ncbi:MAG: acyl-CoA oxidase [Maribacter sp.]|jgi:acyl-CoA oxidase
MAIFPSLVSYSPGILSVIPLFYVGWADSILSPSEIKLIHEKIATLGYLTPADKKIIEQWSNPAKPPSDALYKKWVRLMKDAAVRAGSEKRQSLVDLGLEMAKQSAEKKEEKVWFINPDTKIALESIQKELGIVSIEHYRNIFTTEQLEVAAELTNTQSSFDVNCMQDVLDGKYKTIRNRMRTLLSDPIFEYQTLRDKEAYRNQVMKWTRLLADQGLGSISYPPEQGGTGSMEDYTAVFEMLGYHDISLAIKFGVQFGLFGGSILFLGTKYHHTKYLKETGTLELAGCFAMTETGHGSNVRELQTTAIYDPKAEEFVIHTPTEADGKEYIGNAMHSTMASVFCQLIVNGENHGVHAVLVPLRDKATHENLKGIRVEDNGYKMGLNGVDNGRIWFDHVRVPRENLLNLYGDVSAEGKYSSPIENPAKRFFTMLGTLVGGRVSVPRAGLSATKSGLTIAIKHALKRRQFSPILGKKETLLLDYPSHQARLMPLLAKTYAIHFGLEYLTDRFVHRSEEDIREIETLAAGMKSYATWFTTEALQECREACGGKGYLSENRFADLKADTDIFTTFEGDNTVLYQLVAKGLLSDLKKEFHDEGYRAILRYIVTQASDTMMEYNPFFTRNTDSSHLLGMGFHLETFRFRERQMLYSISNWIRSLMKKRMSSYDAFLRVQTHILELSEAYTERVILEQFAVKIAEIEAPDCKEMLTKLFQLYALSSIEQHKGWYLENDYMTGAKTKAINKIIYSLNQEVRSDALFLVEAFAIPDSLLAAKIAM